MRHSIYALTLTVALGAVAGTAAASPDRGQDHFIRSFDANGDGVVTRQEFEKGSAEKFSGMDANKDGVLSADEFTAHMNERRREWHDKKLETLDKDKDGAVSLTEYLEGKQERAKRRFEEMDRNNDGRLAGDELDSHRHAHGPDAHYKHGPDKKGIFGRMDADKDGVVTRQENAAAWQRWFNKLDADGNGEITDAELQQLHFHHHGS